MAKRVPTPIGQMQGLHWRTAGSINGAVSGQQTTANTVARGLASLVVRSIVVVRPAIGPSFTTGERRGRRLDVVDTILAAMI